MKLYLTILLLLSLLFTQSIFAQVQPDIENKNLTNKERRALRKNLKKFTASILNDEETAKKYFEIINNCDSDNQDCLAQLEDIVEEDAQGSALDNSGSFTFGICRPDKSNKKLHKLIVSKRNYDCKLSSNGLVYDKKFSRKVFGPGLYWGNHSIVLVCTGPAYGKKMVGYTVSAGAFLGVTLTTVVGKIGACVAIGAGKSIGAVIGADIYKFEK